MAYKIFEQEFADLKEGEPVYRVTAVLDSADDLTALGVNYAPGSIAMIATSGMPTYMMNASGAWKEV